MLPLTRIATGLLLAAVDFRIQGLDVLPDSVGWLLVAAGASAIGLTNYRVVALALAALSLVDLALPTTVVRTDVHLSSSADGSSSETFTETSGVVVIDDTRAVALLVYGAAMAVAIWLLLEKLETRSRAHADVDSAVRLRTLRWITAATTVCGSLLMLADHFLDETAHAYLESTATITSLIAVAALLWLIGALYRRARCSWAQ